jgi:CheY-like chemotaxis protein
VEDNEINQMVAVGILTGLGYESDVATDGLEAVRLTATRGYDAVLMDCRMPRTDGDPITRRLDELRGDGSAAEQALVERIVSSFRTRASAYVAGLVDAIRDADPRRWTRRRTASGAPRPTSAPPPPPRSADASRTSAGTATPAPLRPRTCTACGRSSAASTPSLV